MGRFSRHSELIHAENKEIQKRNNSIAYYTVKYSEIAKTIKAKTTLDVFSQLWEQELKDVSRDFDLQLNKIWNDVLLKIDALEYKSNIQGLTPSQILALFVVEFGYDESCVLKQSFVGLQSMAQTNSEALRKLIKKFDKRTGMIDQSVIMLPRLYSASFTIGQDYLLGIVETLDVLLDETEPLSLTEPMSSSSSRSSGSGSGTGTNRAEEIEWLRSQCQNKLTEQDRGTLVVHRGFHHVDDTYSNRPLENTLASFEQVWTANLNLCECDIALTRDGKIVMAHDETFERLALIEDGALNYKNVGELTLRELLSLNLKSGNRPPLLVDVLRSAVTIGPQCKLVIEIKPGNKEIALPLCRMFDKHQVLLNQIEVIMSFDAIAIQRVKSELQNMFTTASSSTHANTTTTLTTGMRNNGGSIREMKDYLNSRNSLMALDILDESKPSDPNLLLKDNKNIVDEKPIIQQKKFAESVSYALSDLVNSYDNSTNQTQLPLFMLVTQFTPSEDKCMVSVDNLSSIVPLIQKIGVDGVYLEYEPNMLTQDGRSAMIELSDQYKVGVWMKAPRDPDVIDICRRLVHECGVSFVNTDLPPNFFDTNSGTPDEIKMVKQPACCIPRSR